MKKLLAISATLLLIQFGPGCTPAGPEEKPSEPGTDQPGTDKPGTDQPGTDQPVPSFALADGATEYNFTYSGGYDNLQTAADYTDWIVEYDPCDWFSASKETYAKPPLLHLEANRYGADGLIFYGDPKDRPRKVEIRIYSADKSQLLMTLPVWQDPYPHLGDGSFKVSPTGGDYRFRVNANCRGWNCSTALSPYDIKDHDNSWFSAEKGSDGYLLLHINPWNPDTEKPREGLITLEAIEGVRSFLLLSYYDPSLSGENPAYGEGGPWD